MVKLLFFIDTLTGGGAEKVLRTLVNNMDPEQFQITVQTIEEADAKKYLAPGIRYKAINRRKTTLGRKIFSLWLRLCAELGWIYPLYIKDDYDIEVAYLEFGPTKFISGSTNKKAAKIAWVHCDFGARGVTATNQLVNTYRKYDHIVCVSRKAKQSFLQIFGEDFPVSVLHNVNDEQEITRKANLYQPSTNGFTFVAIGRLSYEKGVDRLLEACSLLKQDGLEFHLLILGEGPERANLEALIQSLQLSENVTLLGFQENPYPYICVSDCIVCGSRYEGFSTVVTEALILSKCVITTPCSGMDELLGDSEYGLIIDDSIQGIYEGMKQMLTDPEKHRAYTDAAKTRGTAFSKVAVVSETQQFLLQMLERK